jgi:molecular chaperone DnaJ
MPEPRDLYEILHVRPGASPDEIKKSYRRLARKYHPDVNPGDKQAEEKFKEVSAAFEILSDPDKRKLYDELGHDAAKIGWDPEKAQAYRRWRDAQGRTFAFEGGQADFGDLFADLFGGFGRRAGGFEGFGGFGTVLKDEDSEGGEDLGVRIEISLAEAVRGVEREIAIERVVPCSACRGNGIDPAQKPRQCPQCKGSGRLRPARGGGMGRVCATCSGRGVLPGAACARCRGRGVTPTTTRLSVKIPAGIADGGKVRLAGQGNAGPRGGPPGDLFIEVRVHPHPLVRRQGDDLLFSLPITVGEAVGGATITVPTFDGPVQLKVPPGTQSGTKLRLRGKGAPHLRGAGRGDLYAEILVMVPASTPRVKDAAQEMDRHYPEDIRRNLRF